MGMLDYFRPVKTRSAEEVREILQQTAPGDVNLVDVRQPSEYAEGHLPGAQLIPVNEMAERHHELDSRKLTITYCGAGVRSRAAAAVLIRAGFTDVWSMEGGIRAWHGLVAEDLPKAGMTFFSGAEDPLTVIGLCWLLEEGSAKFYDVVAGKLGKTALGALFAEAATAERRHQQLLADQYEQTTRAGSSAAASRVIPRPEGQPEILEGGMRLPEALAWAEDKPGNRILELTLALEAGACDVATGLSRTASDPQVRAIFARIAQEERAHGERMAALLQTGA
jgi:sulfur-carrier protein adenylyltransferase/sulfurtransferase